MLENALNQMRLDHFEEIPPFFATTCNKGRFLQEFPVMGVSTKKIQEEKSKISIQRFKGLGEMNPEELWNTTLNPDTRNLLQVQYSKNLKKDHELIHTLMGNDVSLRKDFIVENAINVSNLDI